MSEEEKIIIGTIGFRELREGNIEIKVGEGQGKITELEGFKLHIPDYQRPYAWKENQVEILLNDLKDVIESKKQSYLLGSLIFHENTQDSKLDIVDGQQRLVTLALICAELEQWEQDKEKWNRVKKEVKELFLMTQKFLHSESQKNLKNNYIYIQNWFGRNQDEIEKFRELLLSKDNNKIEFVCIVTSNLDDAFIFFDSANSKGKKLEDYDLIKAYHLRGIDGLKSIKSYAQKFENLAKNSDDFKKMFRWILAPSRRWVRQEEIDATKIPLYDEFCREIPLYFKQKRNQKSRGSLDFMQDFIGGEDFFRYLFFFSDFIKDMQENNEIYKRIPSKESTFFFVAYLYLSALCLCYSKFQSYDIVEKISPQVFRIVASMRIQVSQLKEERMRSWGCKILPKMFWTTFESDLYCVLNRLEKLYEEVERKEEKGKGYKGRIDGIIKGDANE